ncbi:cation:proton antiporter [Actinokineospora globicatena]|uniref:cation:proton antiporter n=1 Tax=Actinokineospora globicatena TaxID=103729 RepID=UPI002554FF99|nr:cation:proton antiporter [Actinokineospora globicatena]MCP2303845.1 NhaP-type Na+/H+ or K+/H+ antiporter [Actinokineospora globicatena]GLW78998.1 cation transporter [Actinokineospora globicatena]GLW86591.1 cation transporter [Actinokineospora globicatena]
MVEVGAVVYAAAGVATLLAAVLPRVVSRVPVSVPMVFLGLGAAVFAVFGGLPAPDPVAHGSVARHLTELCVVTSLMGAGLALNRPVGVRRWGTVWRLLGISMPLSVVAVGVLGWGVLGLGVAASVLVAAALAPTDPVLATEVQVGEPAENPDDDEDEVRFALTAEAGLNDGLAFPFTHVAVAISVVGVLPSAWLGHWIAVDVLWRLAAGVVLGLATGWLLRKLFFGSRSPKLRLAEQAEGFVALAATFLTYGVTELVSGYGFVAVFVCACTIRAAERSHGYHRILHQYVEQTERMLTVVVVFLLGGAAVTGLFDGLRWSEALFAGAVLVLVRPAAGLAGLAWGRTGPRERVAISFFGVRGVGSLFYIAYAIGTGDFADPARLWRVVGLVVIGSILLHGASATPVMRLLDRLRRREADPGHAPEATPV